MRAHALRLLTIATLSCGPATTAPDCPAASTSPTSDAAGTSPSAQTAPIAISVRERIGDRWEVTYRFKQPARGILFERETKFRASKWSIAADAGKTTVSWTVIDGHEAVVVEGASAMSELKLVLATDTAEKASDYLVHAAFSDGSRLFYTGHFAGRALHCKTGDACDTKALVPEGALEAKDIQWRFETEAGRDIQILDRRTTTTAEWAPTSGRPGMGTYVYFGNIAPRETSFGAVIIDPGLPKWMLDSASATIPKLLDWFSNDTKTKLTDKPLIFVSAPGTGGSGRSQKGGGLPGLVQLAVWGNGWDAETPATREQWLQFLAHELFHIWNGDLFDRKADRADAWLSEGSSDYFAYRALKALGVIDDARMGQLLVNAANQCLVTLGPTPLVQARAPSGRPEYTCGALLWALSDGIARTKKQTVGDVLGRVFAKAAAADRKYGTEDVLVELRKLGEGNPSVGVIEQVLGKGFQKGADELLLAELAKIGIAARRVPPSKVALDNPRHSSLFGFEVARCDCINGRISFTTSDQGLFFQAVPECPTLKNVNVVGYGAHSVPKDGGPAFDALVTRNVGQPLMLRVEGSATPFKLQCQKGYTPPPFTMLLEAGAAGAAQSIR